MIDPAIFEQLQAKIDEETAVRDVSFSCFFLSLIFVSPSFMKTRLWKEKKKKYSVSNEDLEDKTGER